MNPEDLISLSKEIQKAFHNKDLDAAIRFYHEDIILIGPSFKEPISGREALKKALENHFKNPQHTTVLLKDIKTQRLSDKICSLQCKVEGYHTIYYSRYDFTGWLSRIFIETADGPKIIAEHLSLVK